MCPFEEHVYNGSVFHPPITWEPCKSEFLGLQRHFHAGNVLSTSIVWHQVTIRLLQMFSLSSVHSGQPHPTSTPHLCKLWGQRWEGEMEYSSGTGGGYQVFKGLSFVFFFETLIFRNLFLGCINYPSSHFKLAVQKASKLLFWQDYVAHRSVGTDIQTAEEMRNCTKVTLCTWTWQPLNYRSYDIGPNSWASSFANDRR